jgi:dTDP-glucose pyrophosphorylase
MISYPSKRIVRVEEKPPVPKSRCALIGIYMYDGTVFDRIWRSEPSGRGEFEITDVNNQYLEEGNLFTAFWTVRGRILDFDSSLRANNPVAQGGANKIPAAAGIVFWEVIVQQALGSQFRGRAEAPVRASRARVVPRRRERGANSILTSKWL